MSALVSVEAVNDALRLDLDFDIAPYAGDDEASRVADVVAKIAQASDIVLDYLKHPAGSDTWTYDTTPERVKAATIIVVRCLLDDADDSMAMLSGLSGLDQGNLKNPIVALLHRLRDPALA